MRRVLIADDSASNREFLRTILEHEGWTVVEAGDGLTAVVMAVAEPPDLVLLDIQMPGADGYEALRQMRARPELAATPIFAITAYAMEGDKERGLAAGFTGYLTKPLTRRSLLAALC
jgi:two-component system, cell cycle response regulator DivK